jgi:hypothetical protein
MGQPLRARPMYMSMSALCKCKVPGVHAQTERLSLFGRFLFETWLLLGGASQARQGVCTYTTFVGLRVAMVKESVVNGHCANLLESWSSTLG